MKTNFLRLILKECFHNWVSSLLLFVAVIAAVGVLVSQLIVLEAHDKETEILLEKKQKSLEAEMKVLENDYRKLMLKLGLNMFIISEDQNLQEYHDTGYLTTFIPENYIKLLSSSNILTIRHLLPVIEKKVQWKEMGNRNVLLIGTRGEIPFTVKPPKKPIVKAVKKDHIVLGYELWNSLELKTGDVISLLGKRFIIEKIHPQRGTIDDISAWIDLSQIQDLLDLRGNINGIMALQCFCHGNDLEAIKKQMLDILPDTKVIFFENEVTTRAAARDRARKVAQTSLQAEENHRLFIRREIEKTASLLITLVISAGIILTILITTNNLNSRKIEIGILRAIGFRTTQIFVLLLGKPFIIAFFGAIAGAGIGYILTTLSLNSEIIKNGFFSLASIPVFFTIILTAPFFLVIICWIPVYLAGIEDPALILKRNLK